MRNDFILYSETQGRFLVSVNPELKEEFESHFTDLPLNVIGSVRDDQRVIVHGVDGKKLIDTDLHETGYYYKKTLKNY